MRFTLLVLFFLNTLFGANIIGHNIYERSDRVDIMLLFDSPFQGNITKKDEANSTILTLHDSSIDQIIQKNITSDIVQSLTIKPYQSQTLVLLSSKNKFTLTAAKSPDNFGLRLRIKPLNNTKSNSFVPLQTSSNIYTQKQTQDNNITIAFIKVVLVLIALALILYLLKRWLNTTNSQSWLFKNEPSKKQKIKIIYQRALDTKNRVALIEFGEYQYLVILGVNNILLDKFKNEEIKSEFEDILQNNTQKLDEFIKSKSDQLLNIYKKKLNKES